MEQAQSLSEFIQQNHSFPGGVSFDVLLIVIIVVFIKILGAIFA